MVLLKQLEPYNATLKPQLSGVVRLREEKRIAPSDVLTLAFLDWDFNSSARGS